MIFTSASKRVPEKPGLFLTIRKYPFDHIHLGHEDQGVLYKYLESDFHISCEKCIRAQLS